VSVVQPLIVPLYRSKSAVELMDLILGGDGRTSDYDIVRTHWQKASGRPDFDHWWRRVLYDGTMPETALPEIREEAKSDPVLKSVASVLHAESDLELIFRPDPHIFDGRYANNGWLQEAPKPLTKLTWDNAVLLAPSTAEELGVQPGQVVKLKVGGAEVSGPAWIHPGHPKGAATVHLGYGRREIGRVGTGAGFDPYVLRTTGNLWAAPGVEFTTTSDTYELACTQDHSSMEGRPLIAEGTFEEFRKNPEFAKESWETPGPEVNMYPERKYEDRAWGLSVDLNACIGCNACVLACQSENNIAVVGRDQVRKGREMHWIRIDRYFNGDLDQPETVHQPVMCQQCENAPCETVCPVGATNHSDEGLNDMVYNRCIGTRYCSNNCPYKVRRFNFLLYSDWQTETLKMQRNPDVTVRSRGVMEKCTYCIQRINSAKIQAELEDRDVVDGEIKTACQQVCPADAIVFGDINDPESEVAKRKKNPRDYGILTELKTRPRTTYLARVRNPNPRIPETGKPKEEA
jgi:Fe-S-cluster-containing dehydrogenase component